MNIYNVLKSELIFFTKKANKKNLSWFFAPKEKGKSYLILFITKNLSQYQTIEISITNNTTKHEKEIRLDFFKIVQVINFKTNQFKPNQYYEFTCHSPQKNSRVNIYCEAERILTWPILSPEQIAKRFKLCFH